MNDDTGSSRGRQQRAGDLTGIDLLLTARGGGGSSGAAGATTHQRAPRRRNRFSRFRGLVSRPRIVLPVAVIVLAGASAAARGSGVSVPTSAVHNSGHVATVIVYAGGKT